MPFPVTPLRRLSLDNMPDELLIYGAPVSPGRDYLGDPLPAEAPLEQATKCRLRGLSGSETATAGTLQGTVSAALDCPLGTDIDGTKTVRVAGVEYEVVYVEPRSEALAAHRTVFVSRTG